MSATKPHRMPASPKVAARHVQARAMSVRCPEPCGKVWAFSEAHALALAAGVAAHKGEPMLPVRTYRCPSGAYHWTTTGLR